MLNFPGFEEIKEWYQLGFWTEEMVKEGVACQAITADQFKEITGKEYVKD